MKSIYNYLWALIVIFFAASCSDDDNMNTTNATVSFSQSEFSFAESAGFVSIPLKVEGERNGDITVQLKITDGTAISEGHFIVTSKELNIPADAENVAVEILLSDDGTEENDDRNFSITIGGVNGATAGSVANCNVVIRDMDKNPYFKLFGNWTLKGINVSTKEPIEWDVVIGNGNDDSNNEKYFICYGFEESPYNPDVEWVLKYSPKGTVDIVDVDYFYAAYNFGSFIGACCVTPMDKSGRPMDDPIPGVYNSTFDEITFDYSAGLTGVAVYDYNTTTGDIGGYKGRLSVVEIHSMVKK